MRKELQKGLGERKVFRANFVRLGKKTGFKGYSEETILLAQVMDVAENKIVTDHVWFKFSKGFQKVNLKPGSTVEFEARIKSYTKGYVNKKYQINQKSVDFKLSNPTRIKLVIGRSEGLGFFDSHEVGVS